jgi:uncharacterized protein YqjF (DUF2071 family)
MKHFRFLSMIWKQICFAHWRVPTHVLAPHIPRGWEIDLYEGEAWLSVVPFVMENVRLRFAPVLPGFRYVPELNLRTYIRQGNRRAVFFFSLDAATQALVLAARMTTGLPYQHADMSVVETNGDYSYSAKRRQGRLPVAEFQAQYRSFGKPRLAESGSLEEFLHERYLFVSAAGLVGRVFHDPYRLEPAEMTIALNQLGTTIPYEIPLIPECCFYAHSLVVDAAYEMGATD